MWSTLMKGMGQHCVEPGILPVPVERVVNIIIHQLNLMWKCVWMLWIGHHRWGELLLKNAIDFICVFGNIIGLQAFFHTIALVLELSSKFLAPFIIAPLPKNILMVNQQKPKAYRNVRHADKLEILLVWPTIRSHIEYLKKFEVLGQWRCKTAVTVKLQLQV